MSLDQRDAASAGDAALDAALWALGEDEDGLAVGRDEAALARGQRALRASRHGVAPARGLGGVLGTSAFVLVLAQAVWGVVRWWQVWNG